MVLGWAASLSFARAHASIWAVKTVFNISTTHIIKQPEKNRLIKSVFTKKEVSTNSKRAAGSQSSHDEYYAFFCHPFFSVWFFLSLSLFRSIHYFREQTKIDLK